MVTDTVCRHACSVLFYPVYTVNHWRLAVHVPVYVFLCARPLHVWCMWYVGSKSVTMIHSMCVHHLRVKHTKRVYLGVLCHIQTIFLYCCPDWLHCRFNVFQMNQATWAIGATTEKYKLPNLSHWRDKWTWSQLYHLDQQWEIEQGPMHQWHCRGNSTPMGLKLSSNQQLPATGCLVFLVL